HGRGIRALPSRNIDADPRERPHHLAQPHARGVAITERAAERAPMELADTPGRKLERAALGGRKRAARRFHLCGPHAQACGPELDAIEARAEFDQRAVAAPAH